jgi:rod shape determining protein RodA
MMDRRLLRESSFGLTAKLWQINWLYVLLLCTLAGVGYAALYSVAGGSPEPYADRHVMRFAAGLILMVGIAMLDLRVIQKLAWPAYGVCLVLLVVVARYGHVGKGAQRWIEFGGLQLQPSELMKIALVLALASWFHRASWERMGNPLFLVPPLIAVLLPVGLILKEPNLGTALITAMLGGSVFFAAGVRWWKFALVILPVPLVLRIAYAHLHDYQRARIDTFLHPESDPLGAGYNIIQSKIALGSGGMWGKGFLHGTQAHLDFLPEKQTDFIFTTIGEQFGLVGSAAVMTLLALIILGGMLIALRCRNQFGRLVALGISVNFFLYVFVNIAMVMGAMAGRR